MFDRRGKIVVLFTVYWQFFVFDSILCDEHVCEIPCGPNAECTAPNKCECRMGYTLDNFSKLNLCKPSCETPCMEYAACVAPNQCECVEGFVWDATFEICEIEIFNSTTASDTIIENVTTPEPSKSQPNNNADGHTSPMDVIKMENINSSCPQGHVYYKGSCRPTIQTTPCGANMCGHHAYCVEENKCECEMGFVWNYPTEDGKGRCITEEQMRLLKQEGLVISSSDDNGGRYVFTLLGLVCVTVAVLCLIVGVYRRQTHGSYILRLAETM